MLVSPSRLGCRPGIEGLDSGDDLLRWDPLEVQQPPPVSAHRGGEGSRPGVLEADQHRRLRGLQNLPGDLGILVPEHAGPRPFEYEKVAGTVTVEVGDLNARDHTLSVLLDHKHIYYPDDPAVHEVHKDRNRLARSRCTGRKANHDDVDGAQLQLLAAQGSSSGWSAVLRGMPITVGSSAVSRPSVTACRGLTRSLCRRARLALCWPSECRSEGRAHDYMGRRPSASADGGQTPAYPAQRGTLALITARLYNRVQPSRT